MVPSTKTADVTNGTPLPSVSKANPAQSGAMIRETPPKLCCSAHVEAAIGGIDHARQQGGHARERERGA